MIPEINKGQEFYFEHLNRYVFAANYVKTKKVLDLACGSGYGTRILSDAGAKEVIGIDISREAIAYASKKYGNDKTHFKISDALEINLPAKHFDVIVCFEFIEHIVNQEALLKEIRRLLSNDGILVISTPNIATYTDKNKFHRKELGY